MSSTLLQKKSLFEDCNHLIRHRRVLKTQLFFLQESILENKVFASFNMLHLPPPLIVPMGLHFFCPVFSPRGCGT